ncbi:hypothetical protein ASPCADRAFT_204544 [Aspergillus carbonarius ITEM 5010]|uniref:Carrier domain-containing protein n=1 Tax=Aspergillus carbonarius (strain ITEM 5010) TaxID=602072 RepID=A0A1R3RWK3_ASPC5|nr:hypothetical protein ASPCADRAFT_204544 [Aspergillus carbonarius ITEM 5010]
MPPSLAILAGDGDVQGLGIGPLAFRKALAMGNADAIIDGDYTMSYAELNDKALQLASELYRRGIEVEEPVGILSRPGINHITAQLAVAYVGGSSVLLNAAHSDTYLGERLAQINASWVIVDVEHRERLPDYQKIVHLHQSSTANVPDQLQMPISSGAHQRSHVIYTSGTTGKPKAVQILSRGLINLATDPDCPIFPFSRVAQASNVSFDASVLEIWAALLQGATLVITRKELLLDAEMFDAHLKKYTPAYLYLNAALMATVSAQIPTIFSHVGTLMVGGEVVSKEAVRHILQNGPPKQFLHVYGPTESSIWVTRHTLCVADTFLDSLPLGKPLHNVELLIMDDNGHPAGRNTVGELLVGGAGLSAGYFNDEVNNTKAFITLETGFNEPKGFYRTGDLVQAKDDGSIFFVGRKDHQVKIAGHRVELEVIEQTLVQTGFLLEAVAMKVQPPKLDLGALLVAYAVPKPGVVTDKGTVTQAFKKFGPELMVPRLEFVDTLPLTTNGKVDRTLLTKLYLERFTGAEAVESAVIQQPQTPEEQLAGIWASILGMPAKKISPQDDFFALGGTSLQVATMISDIRKAFGIKIPTTFPYQHPKLADFNQLLQEGGSAIARVNERDLWVHDAELGKDIFPLAGPVTDWQSDGSVFITGAAGFVGSALLAALIKMPHVREVICLVRAANDAAALDRLEATFTKYGHTSAISHPKVKAIAGNLTDANLGLGETGFASLAARAGVIFHVGAHMNFTVPYHTVRPTNVGGTLAILRLATTTKQKQVHHISSIAVYGCARGFLGTAESYEDGDLERSVSALEYDIGYSQSKWVAENIVWNASRNGVPVAVYRLGAVLCNSQNGATNPNDYVTRIMKGCIRMGSYPILERHRFDFVSLEFIISSILHIAATPGNLGHGYNLVTPDQDPSVSIIELFATLNRIIPFPLKPMDYDEWTSRFTFARDDPLTPFMPLLQEQVYDNLTRWQIESDPTMYRNDNLKRALKTRPEIWGTNPNLKEMMHGCLDSWIN